VAYVSPTLYVGDLSGSVLNISSLSECGLVHRGTGKYLIINFNAEDLENHFLLYNLRVNRGADQAITISDAGLPEGVTTNPALSNFEILPAYNEFDDANDNFHNAYCAMNLGVDPWLSGQQLRPCAYNFTLSVYDRVTNGKGLIHYSQHTTTLTVLE